MTQHDLIRQLLRVLKPEQILSSPAELYTYEADGFTIAKARPRAVVFPHHTPQVVQIVQLLAQLNIPIIPRGSGTGLTGGCVAFDEGVIVSTVQLNQIIKIDLDNRVAHVQAGVRNTQLSETVAKLPNGASFHFSPDPSSQRAATIGGNAATNAGGIHILKDFASSNHVLGLTLVKSDGAVLTIGATNGCYESPIDLPGIICGSEGTMGIITDLWVRLSPKPTSFRTLVATFSNQPDTCNAISDIIAAGHLPAAMEMMDGRMVQLVEQTFHLGISPQANALILCEIDGIEPLIDDQMNQIIDICKTHHALTLETSGDPEQRAKLWKARKGAFGAIGKISPSYCTQDACVPRSMLGQVLTRINEIGLEHNLTINNVFHAGDGNVHPIFLYDETDEEQVQNVLHAAERILEYCVDIGGTISGEHGIGVEKIQLMPYQFDAATMNQFDKIKKVFDPHERINPGKLIPSKKLNIQLLKPGRQSPQ